jgi:hypothetical protein
MNLSNMSCSTKVTFVIYGSKPHDSQHEIYYFFHNLGLNLFPFAAVSDNIILTVVHQIHGKFMFMTIRREIHFSWDNQNTFKIHIWLTKQTKTINWG